MRLNPRTEAHHRNLAGRMGRWSAHHRKSAIIGWLAFVLIAITVGSSMPQREISDADLLLGESAVAQRILDEAGIDEPASEMVLIQRDSTIPAAAARDATAEVVAALSGTAGVENLRSALDSRGAGLVSEDGLSALVTFDIVGDPATAAERVDPSIAAVASVNDAHPRVTVEQFGQTSASRALDDVMDDDFKRAEMLSLPIILIVLLLAFGAVVAALLPLGFALTAFVAALGLLGLVSQLVPVDGAAQTVMLLVGLAVGVDYSLFYLKREREERARGATPAEALELAAGTAGRSVLISGITVMVAMSGMFITGFPVFTGMGIATILVVFTSVLGSLTVLPAMMSLLGDRVEKGRIPFLTRHKTVPPGRSRWNAALDVALRRPVAAALVSALSLAALAAPALGMQLRNEGISDLPANLPIMQTHERLTTAFPGGPSPAQVVIGADDVTGPEIAQAIDELRAAALATGQMHEPITVETDPAGTVATVAVPLVGDGENEASVAALDRLSQLVQDTVGSVDGASVAVAGDTAMSVAFRDLMRERTPWVFTFVLVLAFALLLVTFRSIVIAVTAIVLNLLSVAAAYGAMVLVFQHGIGNSLLGVDSTGAIINWLPLFLFVILFGLSMDYHVLIISRIREAHHHGASTAEAIERGIKSSAGVVTSAALIMVFVFLCFVTLSMTSMKQIGFGLAIAVLLDATVVRSVLLPATMTLLGERNWYLPRWLTWMPVLEDEQPKTPRPAGEPADDKRLVPSLPLR